MSDEIGNKKAAAQLGIPYYTLADWRNYIKQRALGYESRAVPPDALFLLLEKMGELESKTASPETEAQINMLLKDISNTLLLPGRGSV